MTHWREFLDPSAPSGGYLAWKEVARRTSLSRTTAWRLQKRDEFPRPRSISPGRVGHLACEVEAWIASRAHGDGGRSQPAQPAVTPCSEPVARKTPPHAQVPIRPSADTGHPAPLEPHRPARAKPRTRQNRLSVGAGQQITFNF